MPIKWAFTDPDRDRLRPAEKVFSFGAGLSGLILAVSLLMQPLPASARDSQGDRFITATEGNTFSGTTSAGLAFHLYFLAGGQVTYIDETGTVDSGTWNLDPGGNVCLRWQKPVDAMAGCFQPSIAGDRVTLENKDGSLNGTLNGSVTDRFARHGK
ncbi:MAG: hypothetical protein ACREFM_12810 [Hypericibacter sp.]